MEKDLASATGHNHLTSSAFTTWAIAQEPKVFPVGDPAKAIRESALPVEPRAHGRPWRDRAILCVLLSTGLRREDLLDLNLDQLVPNSMAG